jgi:hypothetical protein
MQRLAALEAEVKGDADAQRARKELALARVREQHAQAESERAELRDRQAAIVKRKASPVDDLGGAIELASRANRIKGELQKKPGKGEKSWITSGVLSLFFGPFGWLYAGSWREAVPAAAVWALIAAIIPTFLLMPILGIAAPISAIIGIVYALTYNRNGSRQRLWGDDKKQLPKTTG